MPLLGASLQFIWLQVVASASFEPLLTPKAFGAPFRDENISTCVFSFDNFSDSYNVGGNKSLRNVFLKVCYSVLFGRTPRVLCTHLSLLIAC